MSKAAGYLGTVLLPLLLPLPLAADGGVTFQDVAAGDGAGITYRRTPSASKAIFDAIKLDPPYNQEKRLATPQKPRGAPGVAILDYDGDGDLDLYVTNGPGTANSLYSNQLAETGETTFVDVAAAAGVEATDQDSTGVCFGDLDNDGDPDLLVLSHNSPDRLFENRGGVFADVTEASGIAAGGVRASSGCTMGDVDGDGLLDVVIGNTYDNWDHYRGIFEPFALNQHNQLFLNAGGNVFVDVSAASGIEDLAGFPAGEAGAAGLTWAVALVDVDLDGDADLLTADDQGSVPTADRLGVNRGILHLFLNDGTGHFTDVAPEAGLALPGSWMGLAFGDFDCDGHLDFFATDFGDYVPLVLLEPGRSPSRWFLANGDGTYRVPGVGDLVTTPFGWGASPFDYDNDGDLDVIYHGGLDAGPGIEASNTGVLLQNPGCSALFDYDAAALAGSTDHGVRTVHGVAVGDLDANGFVDIVSVSNFDIPDDVDLRPYPPTGSPFDARARYHLSFEAPPGGGGFAWVGSTFDDGTLSVELSSGGNGNGWVEVRTVGAVGRISQGRVNRDGIGAVVRFWSQAQPAPGTMKPIVGGSSYASQDALAAHFGLGTAESGTVEVLWPGGVRNRLYDVRAGERVDFPEIPCSIDDESLTLRDYLACLLNSLAELVDAGMIDAGERSRFLVSAVKARRDAGETACAVDGEFKRGGKLEGLEPALLDALAKEGGVTFTDIAAGDGAGIAYRRQPSESKAKFDAIKLDPPYTRDKQNDTPLKSWGAPGVALFDYDGDGDLDVYATNGPGAANSLYANQLAETGETTFVDVGEAAGVGAAGQDSTGVCYGDLDNDGDHDLVVVSHNAPDRLFENRGDGTFTDITDASGIAAGEIRASSGCSMGDVDGDGLLDVVIANTYDNWTHNYGLNVDRFALNQHNQLFLNAGGNVFVDASAAAGVEELAGLPPEGEGAGGLTWAIALADYDLDGDVDLFTADDQSGFPPAALGGVDRGLVRVFRNDGTGRLADASLEVFDATKPGAWMGLSFGDYNCDGAMDFFATNFGDYVPFFPPRPGERPSRWFLGAGDGTFRDPGVGDLVTTPFGWGTSTTDYDNDGDLDVIFHGDMDVGPGIDVANPGVILRNPGCTAEFVWDAAAFAGSTDHLRRNVQGMAVGDLNGDGFVDVVSVSNFDIPEEVELTPHTPLGSPFDATAFFHLNFEPDAGGDLMWVGSTFDPGTLAVELSSGGNGNRWAEVRTLGTVGITSGGRANRDGIGAVVQLRRVGQTGPGVMRPVVGGSSYASQDWLTAHFGLGAAERGIVDVYWPGGARNRLYNVKAGERVLFPEIPCSYSDVEVSLEDHLTCLLGAFDELIDAGALRRGERVRYLMSALRARRAAQGVSCADEESAVLDAFAADL